jgi:hypothetical protein
MQSCLRESVMGEPPFSYYDSVRFNVSHYECPVGEGTGGATGGGAIGGGWTGGIRKTGTVTGPDGEGFGQPRGDAQNAGTSVFVTGCARLSKHWPPHVTDFILEVRLALVD